MHARNLIRYGVVCIPIDEFSSKASRERALKDLCLEISNFPDFNPDYVQDGAAEADGEACMTDTRPLTMASGGSLATASSFHNKLVRELRRVLYPHARRLFQDLVQQAKITDAYNLEELIGCLVVCPVEKATAKARTWHREGEPSSALLPESYRPDDIVFGGWFNFSQHPQHFSCQLRSHLAPLNTDAAKASITVNPGEMLVFFNSIVHETASQERSRAVVTKLVTGWRLTQRLEPLMGAARLEEVLVTGAVVPAASGSPPAMYAKPMLRRPGFEDELETFSVDAIRAHLLVEVKSKAGKWQERVPRVMPSLEEMDETFPRYKDAEKRLYRPSPLF